MYVSDTGSNTHVHFFQNKINDTFCHKSLNFNIDSERKRGLKERTPLYTYDNEDKMELPLKETPPKVMNLLCWIHKFHVLFHNS